jgi:DNA-binding transcriptional LysR family regulator
MKTNNGGSGPALNDMAVFVAVADSGGFSAAARRMDVSKAMVSKAVGRLEERLGVRLMQRTTRRLSLTEAGAAYLPHARQALEAAQAAEEAAMRGLAAPRGTLRINAPMSFGILHLAPLLAEFARRYPEVQVDLCLDDRIIDLIAGGFDLAIRIGQLRDSSLVARPIGVSRNVICAAPTYLAQHGVPATPAALADHDGLIYSLASDADTWTLTRGRRSERVRVRGRFHANNSLALRHALLDGLGIARTPRFVVSEDLAAGRLVPLLSEWSAGQYGIHAVTTVREHLPRKTREFVEFLRERIGEPAYWDREG